MQPTSSPNFTIPVSGVDLIALRVLPDFAALAVAYADGTQSLEVLRPPNAQPRGLLPAARELEDRHVTIQTLVLDHWGCVGWPRGDRIEARKCRRTDRGPQ